jgi:SpoIID/LytB domain protein
MISRLLTVLLVVLSLVACVRASAAPVAVAAPARPVQAVVPPRDAPAAVAPAWPALTREPELGIRIMRGSSVRVRLLVAHRTEAGVEFPAGTYDAGLQGASIRFGSRDMPGPRVALRATTPAAQTFLVDGVRCSGRLLLAQANREIDVIEQVGLETWLVGVLPAEMSPTWPVEALAAQAIVARSYAAARWQARAGQDWHLVRGTADVAYDGAAAASPAVLAAIERTRGELLIHDGQAILARFHACSGGRTEDSAALWPDAKLLDGRTPLANFMRPVDDPASVEGARGLGWTRTHQQWRAALGTADITEALRGWAAKDRSRPRFGAVRAVRIASTLPSGRVGRVTVVHQTAGGERSDDIDAKDFRLIVGANKLRSLWWEKAVMVSAKGGQLVVEGRGFGHGIGLPQVSAWYLANDGVRGEDIVARYYPGATLAKVWR